MMYVCTYSMYLCVDRIINIKPLFRPIAIIAIQHAVLIRTGQIPALVATNRKYQTQNTSYVHSTRYKRTIYIQ